MVVRISHKEVLDNLIRLRETLLEKRAELTQKKALGSKRVYLTLLNLDTGDIQFAQKISALGDHFPRVPVEGKSYKNWKQVRLVVRDGEGALHFEVCDSYEKQLDPSNTEMKPLAWDVLSETLRTLNTIAKVTKMMSNELLPEDEVLSRANLSEIRLSLDQDQIESLEEWMGDGTRIEAEKKLFDKPVGSYLIRAIDPIGQSIVDLIGKNNRISFLNSCLLTVAEKGGKISDILLVRTEKGWTYYQDNVHFREPFYTYYSSIISLIKEIIRKISAPTDLSSQ